MGIWSELKGKKNTNFRSQGVTVYSNEDIISEPGDVARRDRAESRVDFLTALSDDASWLLLCA